MIFTIEAKRGNFMILTFLFTLFFRDNLPPTFQQQQEKIVAIEKKEGQKDTTWQFSNNFCQDYFLLQASSQQQSRQNSSSQENFSPAVAVSDTDNFYILSYCKEKALSGNGQWSWYSADLSADKNSTQRKYLPAREEFLNDYRIFSVGKKSLVIEDKKKKTLSVLSLNSVRASMRELERYKSSPQLLFFELGENWYILYPQDVPIDNPLLIEGDYSILRRLPAYLNEIPADSYWALIDHLFWVKEENLLFFRFVERWKDDLAAYDLKNEEWVFAPSSLLPLSLWHQIRQKKANLLIQISQKLALQKQWQPSDKVYYEIEIDGKSAGKSEIVPDGQEISLLFYLESGRHRVEIIRYVAENEKYVRDNNIRQLNPVTVSPSPQRLIYLYTQEGLPADSKPYFLQGLSLPLKTN